MKNRSTLKMLAGIAGVVLLVSSCSKDEETLPVQEGIQRSELILTEVSGEGVGAHGDHFHGLDAGTEGESITVKFDETGKATSGGHLHLEADAVYKIELKAWDHTGKEVQNDFIASKSAAANYKAFLTGGNFTLNAATEDESGAIFQPREKKYADGTDVTGALETTGILSYFTVGHSNEGATKVVSYIIRKLKAGEKEKITRSDWQTDTKFEGENVLKLTFEVHAEEGHHH